MSRKSILISVIIGIFSLTSCSAGSGLDDPIVGGIPQKVNDEFIPDPADYNVETWIEGLEIPWSLVFLPDGRALITERAGRIRVIRNGTLESAPYKTVNGVEHIGEGGLMGLAAHPDFTSEPYLYIMYTYRDGGTLYNRVDRYIDRGTTADFDKIIVEKIPGHRVHDGGRILFGPDKMLYICTGDIWRAEIAQDMNSLGGKILRYTPDGEIPPDNPFPGSPVYSLGHRNPQGLAWHPETGSLFSSEHGPSGEFGLRDRDIINVIEKGGNYGWPLVVGDANVEPYIDPIIMWPRATPPSGMTFWNGNLYVATLGSEALVRITVEPAGNTFNVTSIDRLFAQDWRSGVYGRLRDAVVGPDNALYILTNNRDGRGTARSGDDKILRLTPAE
jgi:glucose/arabinose dehydrogenase